MFMLSFKMHERYTFPTVAFTYAAYAYDGSKRRLAAYVSLSLLFAANCLDVIRLVSTGNYISTILVSGPVISALYVLAFGWFIYTMVKD
jgi:hypothetical protein